MHRHQYHLAKIIICQLPGFQSCQRTVDTFMAGVFFQQNYGFMCTVELGLHGGIRGIQLITGGHYQAGD